MKKSQRNLAFVVLAIVVVVIAATSGGGSSKPAESPAKAMSAWVASENNHLWECVNGSTSMDQDLALLSQAGGETEANFVTVVNDAKSFAPLCSNEADGIIAAGNDAPPDGYSSLANVDTDIEIWANDYDQKVIIDSGTLGSTNGSNTATTALISDADTSDTQEQAIESEVEQAEKQAGIKNPTGLKLFTWGLTAS